MNKYKRRLIYLLAVQVLLTIIYRFQVVNFGGTDWSYFVAMSFGVFIVIYALKLNCKSCGSGQVFRGLSAFSLRWPQDDCHKCGKPIE
jgi:hypothetical protein